MKSKLNEFEPAVSSMHEKNKELTTKMDCLENQLRRMDGGRSGGLIEEKTWETSEDKVRHMQKKKLGLASDSTEIERAHRVDTSRMNELADCGQM